jgi:hypothetical protein
MVDLFFEFMDILINTLNLSGGAVESRREAVKGLILLLENRFPTRQFEHTLYTFRALNNLINDQDLVIRQTVLGELLQIRANDCYQIQLADKTGPCLYSYPYSSRCYGFFPTGELFGALTESLLKEDRNELFTGLQQLLINRWIMYNVDTYPLINLLTKALEQKIFGDIISGNSPILTEKQKMENIQLGYELLLLLISYTGEWDGLKLRFVGQLDQ